MQKCVWCNRADGKRKTIHVQTLDALKNEPTELEVAVHPAHERKARAYYAERREHVHTSFSTVVGITAALAAVAVVGTPLTAVFGLASRVVPSPLLIACGAALLGIGGTMIVYPFSTPDHFALRHPPFKTNHAGLRDRMPRLRGRRWTLGGVAVAVHRVGLRTVRGSSMTAQIPCIPMRLQNCRPRPRALLVRCLWSVAVAVVVLGCDTGGSSGGESDQDRPPFTSTSVTVQGDTLGLPGTLLVPDTSASVPGVVVVHGSGPLDRDGRSPGTGLPPIYKRWAERMARHGLAVLRYDKRTTQPEAAQADPRALTFLDFVRDAVAAGTLLRNRPEVDASRIVFVGHSQGGNVAPAAATRLDGVVGIASLAGSAFAIDSLFVAQLEAGGGGPNCTADGARAQFDSLRAGQPVADGLICGAGTTFWRQWIRHSQKMDSVAAALEPPLLAQQGRADQNYPAQTLQRTIDAWRRIERADDATVEMYDDVDHLFREAGTSTTADAPLDALITWIQER